MLATLALVDCATLEFGVAPCTQEGETQPLARAARDLAAEPSNCWSKLKQWLRAKAARSLEVLETELGPALATITPRTPRDGFASAVMSLPTDLQQ